MLTGCDVTDNERGAAPPVEHVVVERPRAGLAVRPDQLAPTYPESAIDHAVSVQRLLRRGRGPRRRCASYKLELSGSIRDKRPWTLDELCAAAADVADHAACLRRGLERASASGAACPLRIFLSASAPISRAKYVGFKCADDYYTSIDMADRAAPADDPGASPTRTRSCRAIRLPDEAARADQARLQEPETHPWPCSSPTPIRAAYWEDQGYNWFSGS